MTSNDLIQMVNKDLQQFWPEWKIIRELGKGSYGTVYEAVRVDSKKAVENSAAIKIVSIPSDSSEVSSLRSGGASLEEIARNLETVKEEFENEIDLMRNLRNGRGIVNIEDYESRKKEGELGWDIYIRMELLTPLINYLNGKTLEEKEIIRFGCDICEALDRCSKQNILHRDVKPENIFVDRFNDFKLGDFGIARRLENMTSALSRKGTPSYMAPEVSISGKYDARADIYSLGLVLYWLSNGNRLPFIDSKDQLADRDARDKALFARLNGKLLPAPCHASPEMADLILHACAFDPNERFSSAAEMKRALESVQNGTYRMVRKDVSGIAGSNRRTPITDPNKTTRVNPAPAEFRRNDREAEHSFGRTPKKKRRLFPVFLFAALAVAVLAVISASRKENVIKTVGDFVTAKLTGENETEKATEKATEPPAAEAPQTEAPTTEAPQTEAPVAEAPQTEALATEVPQTEAPAAEAPQMEAPQTEAPASEAPQTEAPQAEALAAEAPQMETPAAEAPQMETPATEAPQTAAPTSEAPQTEIPAEALNAETALTVPAMDVTGGTNQNDALPVPMDTRLHGVSGEQPTWYSFTTGPDAEASYQVFLVNKSAMGKNYIKLSVSDILGNSLASLRAGKWGGPESLGVEEDTQAVLSPNTTYFISVKTITEYDSSVDEELDFMLFISDEGKASDSPNLFGTSTIPSADPDALPGTNIDDALPLALNSRASSTVSDGVWQWYAFTTGSDGGVYPIIAVNETAESSNNLTLFLYDKRGVHLGTCHAGSSGKAAPVKDNDGKGNYVELQPNSTYYFVAVARNEYTYVNASIQYSVTVYSPDAFPAQ